MAETADPDLAAEHYSVRYGNPKPPKRSLKERFGKNKTEAAAPPPKLAYNASRIEIVDNDDAVVISFVRTGDASKRLMESIKQALDTLDVETFRQRWIHPDLPDQEGPQPSNSDI